MRRPANAYWFNLKDQARNRGRGKCEWCQLRSVDALHHRTYLREGHERLEDVMAVCFYCHETIHGLRGGITVKVGSLADLGDKGVGEIMLDGSETPIWKEYLQERGHT